MIVTNARPDPCEAVGGAGAPVDGISPARAGTESTHASAIANTRRFIVWGSPLSFLSMQVILQ
jgi:hypothetical protein